MPKRTSKSEKIRQWIIANPEAAEQDGAANVVAKKFKCHPSLLSNAKKTMKKPKPKVQVQVCGNPVDSLAQLKLDVTVLEKMGLNRVRRILDLLS